MKPIREQIRALGYACESSWLDHATDYPSAYSEDISGIWQNIKELEQTNLFLLDTLDPSPTGGREVELGIIIHRGVQRWRIGPKRNVYHRLMQEEFESWPDALKELDKRRNELL